MNLKIPTWFFFLSFLAKILQKKRILKEAQICLRLLSGKMLQGQNKHLFFLFLLPRTAAHEAEVFGAALEEGELCEGPALVEAEKDLNMRLGKLVISASVKMGYRAQVKALTKRVIAWKKAEKTRIEKASKAEVQAAAAAAKEAGSGVVVR